MSATPEKPAADAIAVSFILACATAVAWPLIGGGFPYYLDNPVHVAEVCAAAFEARNGWSDVAWCGFPVGHLHSPLWYGGLAMLVKAGWPVEWVYGFFAYLGFVAPSIALYTIARRVVRPLWAIVPSWLLLCQYPAIVGVASALGGMWTFHISGAVLLLLIDRLGRATSGTSGVNGTSMVALLTALVLLTHLYATVPVALAAGGFVWMSAGIGTRRRVIVANLAAMLLGVVAAAAYWGPLAAAGELTRVAPQHLSASATFTRLVIPVDTIALLLGAEPDVGLADMLRGIPMQILVIGATAGAFFLGRRRDDGPLLSAAVAATLLCVVAFLSSEIFGRLLGPASWRIAGFVPILLAMVWIPMLAVPDSRIARVGRPTVLAGCVAMAAFAWWLSLPLKGEVLRDAKPPLNDAKAVWRYLADRAEGVDGRVYLQDTFRTHPGPAERSHFLALTHSRTGVRQLGSAYGVAPYPTVRWTGSEFRTLFGREVRTLAEVAYVQRAARATNATRIVSSDSLTALRLEQSGLFEPLFASGRLAVFGAPFESKWAEPLSGNGSIEAVEFQTGRIALTTSGGGEFLVKSAYHPFWRASDGATLSDHGNGLMRLKTARAADVVIEFRPPAWPVWVSVLAWIGIAALRLTAPGGWRKRNPV